MALDPDWTAPPAGHDWRDDELMLAVAWLKSLVPQVDLERRLDATKSFLLAALEHRRNGALVPLYNPSDTIAWYILQAETFATDRKYWTPEGAAQAAPFLTRMGKELSTLLSIKNVEDIAERIMTKDRRQPDGGIYELLVALAYRRGGWTRVEFVPETPGLGKTPDLHVARRGTRWAVECKRLRESTYAQKERLMGDELSQPVHSFSLETGRSIIVDVVYHSELSSVPRDYLLKHVTRAVEEQSTLPWIDDTGMGRVRLVDWRLIRKVLSKDFVYFGSSRMIELLIGEYLHELTHSMSAKWRPWNERPNYADAVYHSSIVRWRCDAPESVSKKARHFKKILSDAESQLPPDRPGVVHVGIQGFAGGGIDFRRHLLNSLEARTFRAIGSRLKWVYGNYFVPEETTRKDESWAITETMVPYRVGSHRTRWPLPYHMILTPERQGRQGVHWDFEPDL